MGRLKLALTVCAVAIAIAGCGSSNDDAAPPPARTDASIAAPGSTSVGDASSETTEPTDTTAPADGSPTTASGNDEGTATTSTTPAPPSTLEGPRTTAEATEEDPVPVGEVVELPGLWDLSIVDVDFDAADVVTEFADINPAPQEGERYVLITVAGVYLGDRIAEPAFEWAVTDGEVEYLPSIPGCGVIPESIYDVVEVMPGEKFEANICVPVVEASIDRGLTLFLQPLGDEPRYFELD